MGRKGSRERQTRGNVTMAFESAVSRFELRLSFHFHEMVFYQNGKSYHIGTPVKAVVDLRQTKFTAILQGVFSKFPVAMSRARALPS